MMQRQIENRVAKRLEPAGAIYFIEAEGLDRVKIGCTKNLVRRFSSLYTEKYLKRCITPARYGYW
jgi:hypothetical protein